MNTPAETLLISGALRHPLEIVQRQGPLSPLLTLVDPIEEADHGTVSSRDGQFRASIPLDWLRNARLDDGRLLIPGSPTRCWWVKDVVSIELTVGSRADSVDPSTFHASTTAG